MNGTYGTGPGPGTPAGEVVDGDGGGATGAGVSIGAGVPVGAGVPAGAGVPGAGVPGAGVPGDNVPVTGVPGDSVPGKGEVAGDSVAGDWESLLSAALLGTDRRGGPGGERDAAVALLDAAAVATVRRRAGLRPAVSAEHPAPAAPDTRPPLPEPAARRLAQLLNDRAGAAGSGGGRSSAPSLAELLPQWLAAANAYGYRPPPSSLPDLLDAARARTDLRAGAVTLAGPRGRWLAGLNADWKFALRSGDHGAAGDAAQDPRAARALWEEGLFAERVALLSALRVDDPAAGLALLRSSWGQERAEDRLLFLDSLRTGLGPADEEFLEAALTDRSRNVRSTAAELLSCLPGSALSHRMAERALACVTLDRAGVGPRVVVEAPRECDAGMERDGVVVTPPSGRGQRAWWLGQLVEAAGLGGWGERLGGRSPEQIVALAVADGWRDDLHGAWSRAAVRQGDAEWARALLGPPPSVPASAAVAGDPARLLSVLPERERAAWVTEFVAAHGLSEAFRMLGACAVPWARPLGRAVIDALDIAREAGSYPWSFSGVMGLAERCLDPSDAGRLTPFTAEPSEDGPHAAPGAAGYWTEAFRRLVTTLQLRAVMHAELAGTDLDGAVAAVRGGC
ncbi:DUF5691 domain-containing protein [Streptomyces sp. SL13]|uniref:DUF5691 domain-containing protein n=1 Tax=Streptantibioticus silvisoli TaxID=2705255 RepID=A0AA90KH60_9ACTN|nr:DUF5691 domain-containing protein [Streptantibioticus silvisoli]MDI5971370.1 DUF5691 domain-containing protein [Streptantibioticus silvisoli]